ncbi:hypothetical protein F5141DRAFT_1216792 [Pisolithus sp. B1]|nr:hypothetical protein F5141DRAFT_1216792 [Pisolithus sp. B1]
MSYPRVCISYIILSCVPASRVIFEIGGTPIREALAREALRQAADKLPTTFESVTRQSLPRLGRSSSPASTTSTATAIHLS